MHQLISLTCPGLGTGIPPFISKRGFLSRFPNSEEIAGVREQQEGDEALKASLADKRGALAQLQKKLLAIPPLEKTISHK